MTGAVTTAYIGDIVKFDKTEDGDLIVYGKAAGPDRDLDGERCDPNWLRREVPQWFEWANVREQHSQIAAGVGIEIENTGDDWHIKAKVTDRGTAHKVETGTLKGWSLGAIDTKTFKDARGQTWLVDGKIVEFSLVDRPCNPTTTLAVAKSAGDGDWSPVSAAGEVIASVRTKAVKLDLPRGAAGSQKTAPDGDPAPAFDRALALQVAAKVRVKDRAGALKLVEPLTTKAVAADGLQDEAPDIEKGKQVIDLLGQLIAAEASELSAGYLDETCDIDLLVQAVGCVKWWLKGEQEAEDEPEAPYADEDEPEIVYIGLSASRGVLFKYVSAAKRDEYAKSGVAMPNGDFPIPDEGHLKSAVGHWSTYTGDKAAAKAHIIKRAKALGLTNLLPDDWDGGSGDDSKGKAVEPTTDKAVTTQTSSLDEAAVQKIADAAVVKALAPLQAENTSLREELAQIKSTAIPGAPFVVAPPVGVTGDDAATKAAGYRAIAKTANDPVVREAYNALAAQTEQTARR
jgi:hypothetical protein